jgi:predicted Zn-dependent peptidase
MAGRVWARDRVDYRLSEGVTRTVLSNGLVVLVKPIPGARSVAIDVVTRVGAAQEDDTTCGIARLIGNILERRLYRSQDRLDDLLDRTGTVTRVNVNLDYTELAVVTRPDHYNEILQRVLQAYGRRPFAEAEVGEERKKMYKELANGGGDFNGAYDLFLQVFYRYHPYRQPLGGNATAVHNLTDIQVNAFFDRWYAPNRTVVCVVGDVDRGLSDTLRKSVLGTLKPVPENTEVVTWEPTSTEKEVPLVSDQHMAFLFLGYPAPNVESSDYAAMKVLSALMGGGVSSRLWMDLREERGLCYELGSDYPALSGPSHFLSFVITRPEQVRASRHRLFVEMDRIRKENVSESELEAGRWKVLGNLLSAIETPQGQASALASSEVQGVGYLFTERFVDSLWRVSSADVKRVANRYLDNYTLLVARPAGTEPILPDHL